MSQCIVTSGFQMLYVPPPGPPLNLSASASSPTQINLSWSAAVPQPGTSIAQYIVYRNDSGNWPPVGTSASSTFTDTNVLASTTYTYYVVAIDSKGAVSSQSNQASATPPAQLPPVAPANLQVASVTSTTVSLTWNAIPGASSYVVSRLHLQVTVPSNSFVDTGLVPSTTYTYQVAATNTVGQGPFSAPVSATTQAGSGVRINWNPANRFQVGNESQCNDSNAALLAGNSDSQVQISIIQNLESAAGFAKGQLIKGYMAVYRWDQLETSPGVFGGLAQLVDPLLAWCQARGIDFSIAINATGNGAPGGSGPYGAPSDTFTSTYGTVDPPNGYYGSVFVTPSTNNTAHIGPIINTTNANTIARFAALGTAIYARYGTNIYAYHPMWSEMSITQYSDAGQVNGVFGAGGLYDKLRASMPRTLLMCAPTYAAFNTHSLGATINQCCQRNHISMGNFDSCNEDTASGGVNPRAVTSDVGYRGLVFVSAGVYNTLLDSNGVAQPSMVGSQYDFFTHHSEDSLGARGSTTGPPSPFAHLGDGRLQIKHLHDVQQLPSHCWWASNQQTGCNAGRTVSKSGAAANYSDNSNTWANLVVGIATVYGTMLQTQYPSSWPQ